MTWHRLHKATDATATCYNCWQGVHYNHIFCSLGLHTFVTSVFKHTAEVENDLRRHSCCAARLQAHRYRTDRDYPYYQVLTHQVTTAAAVSQLENGNFAKPAVHATTYFNVNICRPIFRRDSAVAEPVASGPDDASTPLPAAAPAAVAVDAPASASSPERPPVTFVRVKKDSDPSKIASFICLQLEQRPDDQIMLTAAGNLACLVAVKALAYARNRLLMTRRVSLQFQPQTQLKRGMQQAAEAAPEDAAQQQQQQQGEQSQEQQQQQRPSTQSVLATVNMWASVTPVDPSADAAAAQAPPTVVRVGRNTDARALATALAGLVRKEGPLRVAAVGSGATKNALRALSFARWELVVDAGKDLVVTAEVQRGVRQNAAEASAAAPAPAAAEGAAAAAQEGEGQAGAGGDEIRTVGAVYCNAASVAPVGQLRAWLPSQGWSKLALVLG